jgi:hypothetical protein
MTMLLIRIRPLLLALLALAGSAAAPALASDAVSEQAVRAALVFNFIKFTEWPAAMTGEPYLRLCVATRDVAQMTALEQLEERQVRGQRLAIVRFGHQENCRVIYVDSSQRWHDMLDKRTPEHALTIGAYPGFAAEGGMIEISLQESGARFDINLATAKRAGLRIYPQLLRLARRILE